MLYVNLMKYLNEKVTKDNIALLSKPVKKGELSRKGLRYKIISDWDGILSESQFSEKRHL